MFFYQSLKDPGLLKTFFGDFGLKLGLFVRPRPVTEGKIKKSFDTAAIDRGSSERYVSYIAWQRCAPFVLSQDSTFKAPLYLTNGFIMSILPTCVWYRSFSTSSPMKMPVPEVPPTNRFLQEQPLNKQYCTVYVHLDIVTIWTLQEERCGMLIFNWIHNCLDRKHLNFYFLLPYELYHNSNSQAERSKQAQKLQFRTADKEEYTWHFRKRKGYYLIEESYNKSYHFYY